MVEFAAKVRTDVLAREPREDKTASGLSLPPEVPSLEEKTRQILEALSRKSLNQSAQTQAIGRELEKLGIISAALEEERVQIDSPKTRTGKFANLVKKLGLDDHGKFYAEDDARQEQIYKITSKDIPQVIKELQAGKKLKDILPQQFRELNHVAEKIGLSLKDDGKEQNVTDRKCLIEYYRDQKNYDQVEVTSQDVLRETLEAATKKIPPEKLHELSYQAEKKLSETDFALKDPIQKAAWLKIREGIYSERFEQLRLREATKYVDESMLSGAQKDVWKTYRNCCDPKGEWLKMSDQSWNRAVDEIAINAPLILASGGAAAVGRQALTMGARGVVGRVLASEAMAAGREVGAGALMRYGQMAMYQCGKEHLAAKVAMVGGGMLAEGALFEVTNSGLNGENVFKAPDWAKRMLWSTAMMGGIGVAAKGSERAFVKTVVDQGAQKQVLTALGTHVESISNSAVRGLAKDLLAKGHAEAAAMMVLGASQNACYTGDLSAFYNDVGDKIFHSYLTVGSLKGVRNVAAAAKDVPSTLIENLGKLELPTKGYFPLRPANYSQLGMVINPFSSLGEKPFTERTKAQEKKDSPREVPLRTLPGLRPTKEMTAIDLVNELTGEMGKREEIRNPDRATKIYAYSNNVSLETLKEAHQIAVDGVKKQYDENGKMRIDNESIQKLIFYDAARKSLEIALSIKELIVKGSSEYASKFTHADLSADLPKIDKIRAFREQKAKSVIDYAMSASGNGRSVDDIAFGLSASRTQPSDEILSGVYRQVEANLSSYREAVGKGAIPQEKSELTKYLEEYKGWQALSKSIGLALALRGVPEFVEKCQGDIENYQGRNWGHTQVESFAEYQQRHSASKTSSKE